MKKLLRLILASFLCITLFSNAFAQSEIIGKNIQAAEVLKKLNILNPDGHGIKTSEFIAVFEKYNAKKAIELKEYIATVPELKSKIAIPAFTLVGDSLHTTIQGEKASFKFLSVGEIEINYQDKKLLVTEEMSFKEIQSVIEKTFSAKGKVTLLNFIFPNAHAFFFFPFIILGLCALMLAILPLAVKQIEFKEAVEKLSFYCQKLKDAAIEGLDVTNLKQDLDKLSASNLEICAQSGYWKSKGYDEKTCKETLPSTQKCFKGVIERAESKKIDDSSKGKGKKFENNDPEKKSEASAKKS